MVRVVALASCLAALASASALAARPALVQPFDLVPLVDGRLAVTDRVQDAVFLIDPARRSGRRLARVREARELERLPDGRLLVTSGARVLVVDMRGRVREYARAAAPLLGIARGTDGALYGSEDGKTVVRLRPGPRAVLAGGLDGVHGITFVPGALILSEAYAGRVLRLDLTTREVAVIAEGLGNPSFTLPARDGSYFVSEFTGNRVSRLHADGHVTPVADVFQPGPIGHDAHRRIVGVTLGGTVFRIERGRARTIYGP
jgi:DNA-binding beta-propeller fold protein YncE